MQTHDLNNKSSIPTNDYSYTKTIYEYYDSSNKTMESYLSLVILGAAKTGTTSFAIAMKQFDDVITNSYDRKYWHRCFISPKLFNQLNLSSTVNSSVINYNYNTTNMNLNSNSSESQQMTRRELWLQLIDMYNSTTSRNSNDFGKIFLSNMSNVISGSDASDLQ